MILRWVNGGGVPMARARNKKRRLKVEEVAMVDGRHKLVLVKRDEAEHLVMLSTHHGPVVVEPSIKRGKK